MTEDLRSDQFAWPLTTIDFEASGIGAGTYPIEIGICRWAGPGHVAETFHSLIAIAPEWSAKGEWMSVSEPIHGITRAELADAPDAATVMAAANRFSLLGTIAFCDGGGHDTYWLQRLADAAGFAPTFLLGSWAHVMRALSEAQQERVIRRMEASRTAHRAAADAEDHVRIMAFALGVEEPEFERRSIR